MIYRIFIFLTLGLGFLSLSGCSNSQAAPSEPGSATARRVDTAHVQAIDYQETIKASGQLALAEEARLSFKVGGIIRRIHVREGQNVRAGQLLAEVELDEIGAMAEQAELGTAQRAIAVENARLALRLAERDYRNAKGLYQDSVATLEQLENAEVQLDNARNQLNLAQKAQRIQSKQQRVANYNLRHAKIVAPVAGTILKKLAEPNELVGPGSPVFLFGATEKAMVLRISVTDKDIVHVRLGDRAAVQFDAYPGRSFEGRVRETASMADPYTGTFEVEVELDPGGARLHSGFIGSATLYTQDKHHLLQVPVDALKVADGAAGVIFTLEAGKAQQQKVSIYRLQGNQLLLSGGLPDSAVVIVSGLSFLQDGAPVAPQ